MSQQARASKPSKKELEVALLRAVTNHGHEYNCSAVQGMERDCHCGWLEVKMLVERIYTVKKK